MKRSEKLGLLSAALVAILFAAAAAWFVLGTGSVLNRHNSLQQVQELPVGARVHLLGQVTYLDAPGKRFWIQDETGAAPIPLDPSAARLSVGEIIAVDAVTGGRYDPLQGPVSFDLEHISVHSSSAELKLPPPGIADLDNFPTPEKNGQRVTMQAIVRDFVVDQRGYPTFIIGKSAFQVSAIVPPPGRDLRSLVDASVSVTGVPEQLRNAQGRVIANNLWVPSWDDVHIDSPAPSSVPLRDILSLYRDPIDGHRVRVRGFVARVDPSSFLLEDSWGAIECRMTGAPSVQPGSAVEAVAFPSHDGMRIDLYNASVIPTAAPRLATSGPSASAEPVLTTVQSIRQLSPERAALALPVHVSGVVTHIIPQWGQLYFQDSTGGIFVKYSGVHPEITGGSRLSLTGLTNPGNFAPVIVAPKIRLDGTAPMPKPAAVNLEQAASGLLDSQYATIDGIVHPLHAGTAVTEFGLMTEIGPIRAFTSAQFPPIDKMRYLEDARVRIRGVFGTVFNSRRQLIGYQLLIENPSNIEILEKAAPDPFALTPTPVGQLLSYSGNTRFGHRVKVAGIATLVKADYMYLQDSTGGVEVRGGTDGVHLGDRVEAVGYPTLVGRYSPVMTEAIFHTTGRGSVQPAATDAESILSGRFDSTLVTLSGRLLASVNEPDHLNLLLQSGVRTFTAQVDQGVDGLDLSKLSDGTIIQVTGICSTQVDPTRLYRILEENPSSFQILLRSPGDLMVTHAAPFWTLQTTLSLVAILSLAVVAILVWAAVLRHRVQVQTAELEKAAETQQAIRDLSAAMQDVSTERRFDSLVSVRGSSDIAELVVGFNRMLLELEQHERARRQAESRLEQMALIDELTGLPNRRLLTDRLQHSLALGRREQRRIALVYIDLDGFKLVNDSLGHIVGDTLLSQVAQRLHAYTRQSDTLARLGGDEFTVILENIHEAGDAEIAAAKLLDALTSPFDVQGHTIRIGASVGISVFPDHGGDGGELLQQADVAMYAAKRRGKNQIVMFGNELGNAARQRLILETELRRALADSEITVHYQPEFDLISHRIIRFEALARWMHPTLGPIPPLSFIPIAEESGLIIPLGAYIMERACREAMTWQSKSEWPIQVAVNVSSLQFARDGFIDEVRTILDRTGLHPSLLQIELTESATVGGVERAAAIIDRLKAMGVTIAMDDFGTGYSSLGYLPKLAFDALKIDRSFVNELTVRPENGAFIESILTMAHNLNMRVIVEGIETREQLEIMKSLGADEAQGYLLGRPGPAPTVHLEANISVSAPEPEPARA
ncbi:MAG TPA: EAL domain-containing protein [Acidobacteriaceae bacterium]|nr:EAL domain-containing protein [Acidobacteriaceae bacterium]